MFGLSARNELSILGSIVNTVSEHLYDHSSERVFGNFHFLMGVLTLSAIWHVYALHVKEQVPPQKNCVMIRLD